MKNKFLILMFSLLLAVGWTSNAWGQLKADPSMAQKLMPAAFNKASMDLTKNKAQAKTNGTALQNVGTPLHMLDLTKFAPRERINDAGLARKFKAPNRAPRRAQYDITADKTMTRAEYEAITYNWVDADGLPHPDTKLTEPASDPYQIAYLLGSTYMNKNIPGIKYSAFYDQDHPYPNIEFGWDIPGNARWNGIPIGPTAASTTTNYSDLVIDLTSDFVFKSITVYNANGTVLTSWNANTAVNNRQYASYTYQGSTYYYYTFPGWSYSTYIDLITYNNDYYAWYSWDSEGTLTIPSSLLNGTPNISVVIEVFSQENGSILTVGGEGKPISTTLGTYTWTFNGTASASGGGLTIGAYGPVLFSSITVYNQNNTVLTSWDATTAINNGQISPYDDGGYFFNLPGWNYSYEMEIAEQSDNLYGYLEGEHINIPASLLNGASSIRVVVNGLRLGNYEGKIVVNGEEKAVTSSAANYTWNISDINTPSGSVIPPDDNGYTVFLVKAKDYVGNPPHFTYSWNNNDSYSSLINYFSTYIDEVQLLTDGTRLNEGTDDAGTMFAYSGDLNKFYFISKGANYWFGSSEADYWPHYSPTYDMYEEFSPTTTASGDQITDFYSKLLYGNSYNVIHDCRGVNVMQHYFSMTGNAGSEHKSMTNLIFWIPDHRGQQGNQNNYDEEYLPHVGLYTITLEATAVPDPNVEHQYLVTCDWVSSLNSILDFPVDQDYELWIYVYDEEGDPVKVERVTTTHNTTTYTYPEEQYPDSYTIIYRVHGWPSASTNTPANGGDFFALSNLDPVLIPGYENFLALDVAHYESDYVINEEHNYYRNFMTLDNQNPDNSLTADRIAEGDSVFSLYRFDATVENPQEIKAADLKFSVKDNKVNYRINYDNQAYIDDAHLYNEATQSEITGYKDRDALGYPTSGTIATLGGGEVTPPVVIETHTSTVTASKITSTSATWTGSGGETWNVAVNGGAINQNVTNGYAQIGTRQSRSTSVTFSTSGIEGTIKSIVVDCASYNGLATLSATVGGTAFGTQNQSTPSWSNNSGGNVTFSGSASGAIVITMTNGNNGRAMYIKSIVVTYETEVSGQEVIYITTTQTWGFETQDELNGWTIYDYDQDGYNWDWAYGEQYAELAHTGNGFQLSASNGLTPDNWLMSPEVTLGGTLTLWARLYGNNTTERFGVYVLPEGQTQWQPVGSLTNAAANWTEYSFDLSAYAGQRGQFMIDHWNTSANQSASYLLVDDITYTVSEEDTHATGGFTLLNDFLDNRFYEQVGIVVFELPWKSIQVKLQEESAGTSAGYFMIQSDGKLRFIMPAGYNHANVKFVIRNAPLSSNYHDGTFTLSSSTGATQTITFTATEGNVDREVIFSDISTGDVITITGTHYVDGTLYRYSPDFQYIRVYVQGGTGGISENDALNLAAIQFVDQFKAETREDKHPYRYGYVLRQGEGANAQESAKPEVPVQHTGAATDGYYTLSEIDNDTNIGRVVDNQILHDQGITMNVMNGQVEMKLTSNPEVYYYTLDRKPSNDQNAEYLEISKLQKREDDTYQEVDNILSDYQTVFQPVTTPRFDNYDVQIGQFNDYMSYVPIVWTHGDQDNRRIKWNSERRHNSYGAPIWKTGVGDALLYSATAEKQQGWNTTWMDGDTQCRLYMLDGIEAWGYLPSPTVTNTEYEPYMFRVFVESKSGKLRNFTYETVVGEDGKTNEVIVADATTEAETKVPKCVWSAYLNPYNDEVLAELNGACDNVFSDGNDGTYDFIRFAKNKVDRTDGYDENGNPLGAWDQQTTNAIFGLVDDIKTIMQDNVEVIDPNDLTIFVRFYYIVKGMSEGWTPWNPNRAAGNAPGGYGAESPGKAPNPATAVSEVRYVGEIVSQTYYNIQGMVSDKPFDGVNIVVTRYSDGSSSVAKIIR